MQKGFSAEAAASRISLFYLGITCGRFLSGFLTLKLSNKNIIRLGQGIGLLGIVCLLCFMNDTLICLGLILIGLGCAPIFPSLLHQTPIRFGKNASQSMMGLQMACGYLGSTFSPLFAGWVVGKTGAILYPFLLMAFMALMIITVEICNRKTEYHAYNREQQ